LKVEKNFVLICKLDIAQQQRKVGRKIKINFKSPVGTKVNLQNIINVEQRFVAQECDANEAE
jgi:hypothetical protein